MTFQSFHFLVFFLSLLMIVRLLLKNHNQLKKVFLLVASYYFYMCWDWRFAGLILFVTVVNYLVGPKIAEARSHASKTFWLWASLAPSLLVLACFKYANFFIDSFVTLLATIGLPIDSPTLNIILPVGISFYTFQSISYTLDIYRGRIQSTRSLLDYALFVAFFPSVLAGPILRASHFLPQLRDNVTENKDTIETGFALILRGFIKKVAIADVLGLHIVDPAFAHPEELSPVFLLIALYAYSYQVYMDISGYTDIARGVSRTLGYELQINFNRPYKATSISEFWQRWHISMSSFFRDYLYFGLGGSKYGNVYRNLLLTFVAIGIWHGAGWNFIVYGVCHGGIVCWERWRRQRRKRLNLPELHLSATQRFAYVFLIFNIVSFTRILFRGGTFTGAIEYAKALLNFDNINEIPFDMVGYAMLIIAMICHYTPDRWTYDWKNIYTKLPHYAQAMLIVSVIYLLIAFSSKSAPFIYFQF